MTFDELNLNTPLLNALSDMGISTPTTIQEKAFSVVMSGADVVGIAQTGTGKTLAYLLPSLRQWSFQKDKTPQIIVLVPTRELVVQVVATTELLTKYMNVTVVGVYGGTNINTQSAAIVAGVDVLVTTPGRLLEFLLRGIIKTKLLRQLVIDEVDEMLHLGFRTQLTGILDLLPKKRQNLMFSATMPEDVEKLTHTFFNHPTKIEAAPAGTPLDNIDQQSYLLPNFNTKMNMLDWLFANDSSMTKILLFVDTKRLADALFERLKITLPEQVAVIHSNKEQSYRFRSVNDFKSGSVKVLIATDLIARGLDIASVSHVVNFDVPDVAENYIHRIGRTGRYDQRGIAITFFTAKDTAYRAAIEGLMKYEIPSLELPDTLTISAELTPEEMPIFQMPNIQQKVKKRPEVGPAFHEKSAKNSKTNNKVRHADKMKLKYGKPKKRKPKQ